MVQEKSHFTWFAEFVAVRATRSHGSDAIAESYAAGTGPTAAADGRNPTAACADAAAATSGSADATAAADACCTVSRARRRNKLAQLRSISVVRVRVWCRTSWRSGFLITRAMFVECTCERETARLHPEDWRAPGPELAKHPDTNPTLQPTQPLFTLEPLISRVVERSEARSI